MSDVDLSALAKLAGRKPPPKAKDWTPLDLTTLAPGTYLSCDQSLTACGLVLFEAIERELPVIHMAQKITVDPTDFTGWEDILRRAATLYARLRVYVEQWIIGHNWGIVRCVHEAPPIGRGKMVQPEISLLTAREFRRATEGLPQLPMVRRQDHAKLVCGNGNATKQIHHAALKDLIFDVRGAELITNEAHRDALSVGLAAAAKRGHHG